MLQYAPLCIKLAETLLGWTFDQHVYGPGYSDIQLQVVEVYGILHVYYQYYFAVLLPVLLVTLHAGTVGLLQAVQHVH
jgi:hypothetical protein